jgi:hypothetical protein
MPKPSLAPWHLIPALGLLLGCGGNGRPGDIPPAPDDDDDDSAAVVADDDDTVMPPDDSLHGSYPTSELPLPQFEALNSDGGVRGPDQLRGHPTVLWFFPFAGTPT